MEQYILYLNLFVIFNLSLLIASLLLKKNRQKSNYFLALLILINLSTAINNLSIFYFHFEGLMFLQISSGGFNLIYGPVLLALVAYMHEKEVPKSWKWHLLPALGFFLYGLHYLFLSEEMKKHNFQQILNSEHLLVNILNFIILIHAIVYMFIAKRQLKRWKIEKDNTSFWVLQLKHQWATDFVNYQIVAALVMLIAYVIPIVLFSKPAIFCDIVVGPCVSLSIYSFIVFKNFQFNAVYERVSNPPVLPIIETAKKVQSVTLYSEQTEKVQQQQNELKERLEIHLIESKSYANPAISLHKLAEELTTSPNVLSQTINQHFGVSFFELINNLRVEEAKNLLLSEKHQHLKVEAIGEMAGFNSRSTFFAVFKKLTGITPTAFKNALNV